MRNLGVLSGIFMISGCLIWTYVRCLFFCQWHYIYFHFMLRTKTSGNIRFVTWVLSLPFWMFLHAKLEFVVVLYMVMLPWKVNSRFKNLNMDQESPFQLNKILSFKCTNCLLNSVYYIYVFLKFRIIEFSFALCSAFIS